jgi:hypothetical protein
MRPMFSVLIASVVIAAGCASRTPTGESGKYLVYREASGTPTMQIDYPSEDFCRQVESIARRDAHCEPKSADTLLNAHATLRYNPPGMEVEGHYPDLVRCQKANARMAAGVELVKPCAAKDRAIP